MAKARTVENLDCAAGAREGMQRVLETRRAEVFDYSGAALDFSDIKGVHAMRVATRRLRGVLRDFRPHLSRRVPQRKLKRLADALGAVRDQDVAIKRMEELAEKAGAPVAGGLDRLMA
ncbi:MAG: CHAD domain-containing protein, partial [Pyrinomonadaceae bacterium]